MVIPLYQCYVKHWIMGIYLFELESGMFAIRMFKYFLLRHVTISPLVVF